MVGWTTKRQEVAAYVEYLRDSLGLGPEKWAAEVGTSQTALTRRLYRAGRPDLARPLQRLIRKVAA